MGVRRSLAQWALWEDTPERDGLRARAQPGGRPHEERRRAAAPRAPPARGEVDWPGGAALAGDEGDLAGWDDGGGGGGAHGEIGRWRGRMRDEGSPPRREAAR